MTIDWFKWLEVGTTVLDVAANLNNGRIEEIQGARNKVSKDFEAAQLREQAFQDFASSQRLAIEENRQAEYVASRAIAVAGASGGSVTDPNILNAITRIKSEGALRAMYNLYEGETAARNKRRQAAVAELEGANELLGGKNRKRARTTQAIGALAEGASSLYTKYGARTDEIN